MKEYKGFVWYGLRVTFWIFIIIWIGDIIFIPADYPVEMYWEGMMAIMFLLLIISMIGTFVLSIIHLTKHKKKGLAITALVISSIWVFIFFIGFVVGIVELMQ